MNKRVLFLFALLFSIVSFAQQERKLELNKDTNLIDVTYYHDNGAVSQTGTYTLDGKLQGEWLSYDIDGNKNIAANYDNGKKVGKWFYWTDKTLTEVDYTNNAIASINEWQKGSKSSLASRNK
ncbi:nicotinic acid mononucleotide adenyltransferase [Winogradskyella sp.]|nr:nicotinic acid mononucleotide adenyltransferase [Winogradskyella sp.]MDC1504658.1 nicotinic acid mononucleotide adenyltransferase [Winogradskyella sp.]